MFIKVQVVISFAMVANFNTVHKPSSGNFNILFIFVNIIVYYRVLYGVPQNRHLFFITQLVA